MPYNQIVNEILARELGAQSIVQFERTGVVLDTKYLNKVEPPAGYEALVVYRITASALPSDRRGIPTVDVRRLATSATTYGTAATYTVGADPRRFELQEISLNSDNFSKTNWRLTIRGTVIFEDLVLLSPLTLPFRNDYLAPAEVVLLEAASTDGTAIIVNGSISGRLFTDYDWQVWLTKRGARIDESHTFYLTDDVIGAGINTWAYATKSSPLRVEYSKLYGSASDRIAFNIWATKVATVPDFNEIKRLALNYNVKEELAVPIVQARVPTYSR